MSTNKATFLPAERIENKILLIRGEKVLIDADLAELYAVSTKRLNEQVKRNPHRFPKDFMFRLTENEKREVVANCDHLARLKFSPTSPYAFTEHGALMAASVLNSKIAISVSVEIIRAFVRLRQLIASHANLARRIDLLEKKYDGRFRLVFDAIRKLMIPPTPEEKKREMGFQIKKS